MTGTVINVIAILLGGGLGFLMGSRFPERIRRTIMTGLGLFTLATGLQMFLKTENPVIVVLSLVFGILLGEWWNIEEGIRRFGNWLEKICMKSSDPSSQNLFLKGFLTASLLFGVGPMAILGSIQDGLTGDYKLLIIKSILDCFAAMAFATSMGIGVLFSVIPVLIYQGSISLLASQVQMIFSDAMISEMTACGGVILMAIAISSLLEIKPIRSGNFLPALFLAPLLAALMGWLNISF